MTDDNRPLRALFGGEEYRADDSSSQRRTALQVIDEANRLNAPLGELLLTIFRREPATLQDLAETLDLPQETVKRHITELKLQGYITTVRDGDTTMYRVAETWETEDFPSGPVIPLVYQYNLLSDRQRLEALRRAIEQTVNDGDVVADLGAGAGVLSYLAAEKAEQVYAVELDADVYDKGKDIIQANDVTTVEYKLADARVVDLPEPVDVVLCEMLDTALAAELQVPVMNHANETLLAEDGTTVPVEAKTTATIVQSNYEFVGGEFRLPHFEAYGSRESVRKSDEEKLHHLRFDEVNDRDVHESIVVTASADGVVNGIQLNTYVRFAPGLEYTSPSEWLNPPLTLPLDDDLMIEPGDRIEVAVDYRMGDGLNDIDYTATPLD